MIGYFSCSFSALFCCDLLSRLVCVAEDARVGVRARCVTPGVAQCCHVMWAVCTEDFSLVYKSDEPYCENTGNSQILLLNLTVK